MKLGMQRNLIKISIITSIISSCILVVLLFSMVECSSKAVVRHEFVVSGSDRYQMVLDSLTQQIQDCENALWLHEEAKGR